MKLLFVLFVAILQLLFVFYKQKAQTKTIKGTNLNDQGYKNGILIIKYLQQSLLNSY